eukprot:8824434-Alexandrium_andersonii.AAC.1
MAGARPKLCDFKFWVGRLPFRTLSARSFLICASARAVSDIVRFGFGAACDGDGRVHHSRWLRERLPPQVWHRVSALCFCARDFGLCPFAASCASPRVRSPRLGVCTHLFVRAVSARLARQQQYAC